MTERDANWQQIEASNNIREWQKMLISLTLLSKKFKVRWCKGSNAADWHEQSAAACWLRLEGSH